MAICFYWLAVGVGLGHMFLLCGARPYVSIMWGSAICFYCVCVCANKYEIHVRRGSSLVGSVPLGRIPLRNLGQVLHVQEIIVRRSGYLVGSRPIPMEPSAGHVIKYYKGVLDIG